MIVGRWSHPSFARKLHYWREKSTVALCGRPSLIEGPPIADEDGRPARDYCGTCVRALDRLRRMHP